MTGPSLVQAARVAISAQASWTYEAVDSVAVGDLLVVKSGAGSYPTSISDSLNGAYTLGPQITVGSVALSIWWTVATVAGTPTVTVDYASAVTGNGFFSDWTGFVGPLAVDATLTPTFSGTATSFTCDITNGFQDEVLELALDLGGYSSGGTGWTKVASNNASWYAVEDAANTVNNFSITQSGDDAWAAALIGIYDVGAAFAAWNVGELGVAGNYYQSRVITAAAVLATTVYPTGVVGPQPCGTLISIFPVAVGTSGSLVINDCATLAEANGSNQVLAIAASAMSPGSPITPAPHTFVTGIVVSAVPAGGKFGFQWNSVYAALPSGQA